MSSDNNSNTEEMDTFDFEESINMKKKSIKESVSVKPSGSVPPASVSVEDSAVEGAKINDGDSKKKFVNGIDMFAVDIELVAENYSVSILCVVAVG